MPNPPDRWTAFSTAGMTDPKQLADALSAAFEAGYEGEPIAVPDPSTMNLSITWIAVPGYKKRDA